MRAFFSNLFWKIVYQLFRLKWYWNSREERKNMRERQRFEYILHGYRACIFHWDSEFPRCALFYKTRLWKLKLKLGWKGDCKKGRCKEYLYDPMKGSS